MKCMHIFAFVSLLFLLSCTMGERNNPFDPVNSEYDAPKITMPIEDQTIRAGQPVRFEIFATGGVDGKTIKYQWSKDGIDLRGETTNALVISVVTASNAGTYSCLVSNLKGSTSSSAKLMVLK